LYATIEDPNSACGWASPGAGSRSAASTSRRSPHPRAGGASMIKIASGDGGHLGQTVEVSPGVTVSGRSVRVHDDEPGARMIRSRSTGRTAHEGADTRILRTDTATADQRAIAVSIARIADHPRGHPRHGADLRPADCRPGRAGGLGARSRRPRAPGCGDSHFAGIASDSRSSVTPASVCAHGGVEIVRYESGKCHSCRRHFMIAVS